MHPRGELKQSYVNTPEILKIMSDIEQSKRSNQSVGTKTNKNPLLSGS